MDQKETIEKTEISEPPDPCGTHSRASRIRSELPSCTLYHGSEINGNPQFHVPYEHLSYDSTANVLRFNSHRVSRLLPLQTVHDISGAYAADLEVSISDTDLSRLASFSVSVDEQIHLDRFAILRAREESARKKYSV